MSSADSRQRRPIATAAIIGGTAILLLALFIVLRPGAAQCPQESIRVEATVTAAGMEPSGLQVCRGQQVELVIQNQSDLTGLLHVHGYDDLPDGPLLAEMAPGSTLSFRFEAARSGQFPIEVHGPTADAHLGVLMVDEP